MLRYKTETRPGLVALYDIRPGNGAGLFLQPRSPHDYSRTVLKSRENTNANIRLHYVVVVVQSSSIRGLTASWTVLRSVFDGSQQTIYLLTARSTS